MTVFEAYITNLGKYAEGQLVGETLKFPATTEEVQSLLKNIGVDGVRYRSFCPGGNLVGECLPQTLLMRLTPLEKFPQILFGLFQKQFRYTPRFSPISERTPRTERRSTTYETI